MRRLIPCILALALIAACACGCVAESAGNLIHNYILIIDNSRSTTGRHSLGSATDPHGLRFDAAKLVYENVLSSAATGSRGKIGVIVFCGTENCVCYGPMDIDEDPAALDEAIGSRLNAAANADRRDNYTDIRTALEAARDMMLDFAAGDTSVILLTDGVNDLTNVSDPFSQPENIEANDRSVELVEELRRGGADFYLIALTASDSVLESDAFMAFINRLAQAGGGEPQQDGAYGNVLMATQSDLNSKLVQMLIKAESAPGTVIQNIIEVTPARASFTVPYEGISEATINITFMPEDKDRLEAIQLISPDDVSYTLYDADGAQPCEGFSVADDRSYIMLGISAPQPGEWALSIASREQAAVPIDAVVRFNHKLRLCLSVSEPACAGKAIEVRAWFQRYDGEQYLDLTGSDICRLSTATLTLTPPGGEEAQTIDMAADGDRFVATVELDKPGGWTARASARNDYLFERTDALAFELTRAPIPEAGEAGSGVDGAKAGGAANGAPSANGLAGGKGALSAGGAQAGIAAVTVNDDGSVTVQGAGGQDFSWNFKSDAGSSAVSVSWQGGPENATAAVVAEGASAPVVTDIQSGDSLDLSALDADVGYTLMISSFGAADEPGGTVPVQQLDFRIVPDAESAIGVAMQVANAIVKMQPTLLTSQQDIQALESSIRDTQQALADAAGGAKSGASGAAGALPAAQGGSAGAAQATGAGRDAGGDGGADADGTPDEAEAAVENGAEPTAGPTQAASDQAPAAQQSAEGIAPDAPADDAPAAFSLPGVIELVKQNWLYAAGGALGLALLIAILLFIKDRSTEKVTGSLRIECQAIFLSMLLRFEGSGRIKVNAPLTKHPDVAKLKGGKVYDVLSNIRVGMVKADRFGKAPGSDAEHAANDQLIRLTYTDPDTNEQQICDVGQYDAGPATLRVKDTGRYYDLILSANLTFDELLYTNKK